MFVKEFAFLLNGCGGMKTILLFLTKEQSEQHLRLLKIVSCMKFEFDV